MSEPTPERPMDDDLDQAYARSHALADDGRGPSASVRANVLAAAARIAAGAAPPVVPVVPVAPPVAAVGRKRGPAVNLSSWRVRSGAALCALLLVCVGVWRFDQNGRLGGGVQVAQAELRLAEPRTAPAPAPQDLPLPAAAAPASYPYAAPPQVVVDPLDGTAGVRGAAAKRAEPERGVVVAQLDARRAVAPHPAPQADGSAPPGVARPPVTAAAAAPAPPVALASNSTRAEGKPAEQEAATVAITAAAPVAPPAVMTSPPQMPSVLPRRTMLVPRPSSAPAARPAPGGDTAVALAETPDRARDPARMQAPSAAPPAKAAPAAAAGFAASEPDPTALARPDVRLASTAADPAARAKADTAGVLARASVPPSPLQAAADRGDVDALKALLADPATRVDTPDADGRTALLHAVLAQRPAAVRLLLAAGADPGHADHGGVTPRQAAQVGASAEIAALLGAPR